MRPQMAPHLTQPIGRTAMQAVRPIRLGVLASGGGTNLQALIDRSEAGKLSARVVVVVSNNSDAGALERARRHGIPVFHLSRVTHPDPERLDAAIRGALLQQRAQLVCLAGYMRPVGPLVRAAYRDAIVNIHPALLPKFGGPGMHGLRVHEAVLRAGERETGVTVHLVTPEYDAGPALAQRKVPVGPDDTPETLQQRVLAVEHELYAEVIQAIAEGRLTIRAGAPSGRLT